MPLLALPTEVVLHVAECLIANRDVGALARCNRHLYGLLNGFLYRRNQNGLAIAAPWAVAREGRVPTLRRIEGVGLRLTDSQGDILHTAVGLGVKSVVRYLLDDTGQFEIESWDADGRTPLIVAVEKGGREMVELLLEKGANPSGPSDPVWLVFPIHRAIQLSHFEIATLLALRGADLGLADGGNRTPLVCAVQAGQLELAELLLDMGANVNQCNGEEEEGILHSALSYHDNAADLLEMVLRRGATMSAEFATNQLRDELIYGGQRSAVIEVLLQHGANPNPIMDGDDWSEPPLTMAFKAGYFGTVKVLAQNGAHLDARDERGMTALHHASSSLHVPSTRLLLDAGADATLVDNDGNLAMTLTKSAEIVAMMLEKGVDVNHSNNENCTPLVIASVHGYDAIGKLLLKAGADLHYAGDGGWTALCAAVNNNQLEMTRILLDEGADPGDDRSGHSALFDACSCDLPEMAQLLLEHGADISSVCRHGNTALCHAATDGHREVVECLLKNGADVNALGRDACSPLLAAAGNGDLETVKLLLDRGADMERADHGGYTPLLEAVARGHEQVVRLLLAKGARVDGVARAGAGATALSVAAAAGHGGILKQLLRAAKWNLDAADLYGRTALLRAAMRGHVYVVDCLLACDPPPNIHIEDHWGATALAMAARNGGTEVVRRLLRVGEYSTERLLRRDRAGRGVCTGVVEAENPTLWALLVGAADAAGVPREEMAKGARQDEAVPFKTDTCYCDICGRCSTCTERGPTKRCVTCEADGGGGILICRFCVDAQLGCLSPDHIWQTYEDCSCHDEMEDGSDNGSNNGSDNGSDNSDNRSDNSD